MSDFSIEQAERDGEVLTLDTIGRGCVAELVCFTRDASGIEEGCVVTLPTGWHQHRGLNEVRNVPALAAAQHGAAENAAKLDESIKQTEQAVAARDRFRLERDAAERELAKEKELRQATDDVAVGYRHELADLRREVLAKAQNLPLHKKNSEYEVMQGVFAIIDLCQPDAGQTGVDIKCGPTQGIVPPNPATAGFPRNTTHQNESGEWVDGVPDFPTTPASEEDKA